MTIGFHPQPKPEPRVLRDAAIERERAKAWTACKARVRRRDGYRCRLCGKPQLYADPHHIIEKSLGGRDVDENLIAVCRPCHDWLQPHLIRIVEGNPERPMGIRVWWDARVSGTGAEREAAR